MSEQGITKPGDVVPNPSGQYRPPGTALAVAQTAETAGMVLAAQAKALVEARYTIAIKAPRDEDAVRARLLRDCARPSFAEVARYRKPVGKGIEGPSIRFAEAALRAMGNILIETPTIYDDREKRIVRVSVADLESNIAYSQDVTVPKAVERRKTKPGDVILRKRTNSYGDDVYLIEATDDEILNTQQALISKAIRTLGLRLVPGWLIDECMEAVIATAAKRDAADPDAAKRKLLDAFGALGVTVEQVKAYLGHDGATLQPAELTELRAVYAALKDGETTWREVMDARSPAPATPPTGGEQAAPAATPPAGKGNRGLKERLKGAAGQPGGSPGSPPTPIAAPTGSGAVPQALREPGSDDSDEGAAP